MIIIIAALGKNREIGEGGKLPWYLPNDLEFFKKITFGSPIVMGRKTFESLPKLLPNRKHIVITSDPNYKRDGIITCPSIEDFLSEYKANKDIFIIGGSSIYEQFLDYTSIMYLTEINKEYPNADTFFPNFDKNNWHRHCLSSHKEKDIDYLRTMYVKKLNKS